MLGHALGGHCLGPLPCLTTRLHVVHVVAAVVVAVVAVVAGKKPRLGPVCLLDPRKARHGQSPRRRAPRQTPAARTLLRANASPAGSENERRE